MTLADVSVTSDRDYLKIVGANSILMSATGAAEADATFPNDAFAATLSGSIVIPHNLGSMPLVRVFWDPLKNGRWWASHAFPDSSLGLFPFQEVDPFVLYLADTSNLKLILGTNNGATSNVPVYYRIYTPGVTTAMNSDAAVDKIFKKGTGGTVAPAAADSFTPTFTTVSIPHGAGEVPLWTMQFSQDGSNWYNENGKIVGPPDTSSGPPGGPYSRYYYTRAFCWADSVNFNMIFENNYNGDRTMFYRYALDYKG